MQEGSQAAQFVSRAEYEEWGSEICRRKFTHTY
jgi:actin-related protein